MQVELTIEQIGYIERAIELMPEEHEGVDSDELYAIIVQAYCDAEELEGMDLNDCGDACKL